MAAIIVNLECMTNMHVGNGDVNYYIIDYEVEKDPVTGYPTINASGVKGAFREYFKWRFRVKAVCFDIIWCRQGGRYDAGTTEGFVCRYDCPCGKGILRETGLLSDYDTNCFG